MAIKNPLRLLLYYGHNKVIEAHSARIMTMYHITLTSIARRSVRTVWHATATAEQAAEELRFWRHVAGSSDFVTMTRAATL
jgi:hypothetical protein